MTFRVPLSTLLANAHQKDLVELATAAPPGAFVEVGVYKGGSAELLYKVAEAQGRVLHLFDTFTGHPTVDPERDDVAVHPAGRYNDVGDLTRLYSRMPNAQFHIGVFPDTWDWAGTSVAFVHSDVDLYWPTAAVCKLCVPVLCSGGMILFDDYPYDGCPGVRRAVEELLPPEHVSIRPTDKALYTKP